MNKTTRPPLTLLSGLAAAGLILVSAATAKANVFASNIKILGALTNGVAPIPENGATIITYILNEPATAGTTINIYSNVTVIDTISIPSGSAGTLKGLNTVGWGGTNSLGAYVSPGNYTLSITPAATGYANWTQITTDSNPGNYVLWPAGMAVNCNTNSPYYGRVIVANSGNTNTGKIGDTNGLFKYNADGSFADEGQGNAGYSFAYDGTLGDNPRRGRIAADDRFYFNDWRGSGKVVAVDMLMMSNQTILDSATFTLGDAAGNWSDFDVTDAGTTNAKAYLTDENFPGEGLWVWPITNNGAQDVTDDGVQVVRVDGNGTAGTIIPLRSVYGLMLDESQDIFIGELRSNPGDVTPRATCVTNWPSSPNQPLYTDNILWQVGQSDNTFEDITDLAIDSRTNPHYVACTMNGGSGGIRILNAATGATVTNLQQGSNALYLSAAWDNVGNVYGGLGAHFWRAFSPPGANQSTTMAVETMSPQLLPASVSLTTTTFSGNAATNATPITATYSGSTPISLQWYYTDVSNNTFAISGQVSNGIITSTLLLSNVLDSQNGAKFYLVASNAYGPAVTSSVATLTVVNPTASLAATTFSGDANGNAGPITVTFNGIAPEFFQWYSVDTLGNTNSVFGQTNATLSLTGLSASQNGYKYFAVVSWPYAPSVATTSATLTVYNSPAITTNLTSPLVYVPNGFVGTLTVGATGALPLNYQWFENGGIIPGANTSTYTYTATNGGSNTFNVLVYNSVNEAGIQSSNTTVVSPMTALSFSSNAGTNSSQGWSLNGGATFSSPGVLQLTTATNSEARSAFYSNAEFAVNGFIANFTYVPSAGTSTRADGITFCLQGNGPTKVGGGGGSLGVSGITPSVELEMNIFSGAAGGIGISYNTNGTIGPNSGTGSVNINSGDPINVTIFYNPKTTNVFVKLVDGTTAATFTTNYTGINANITNILGSPIAWVGFTGATGGDNAVQQVSNFLFQNTANVVLSAAPLTGGNIPLSWNVAGMGLISTTALQGSNTVWTPVVGTVTTNFATGQAQTTVTPAGPTEFFELISP